MSGRLRANTKAGKTAESAEAIYKCLIGRRGTLEAKVKGSALLHDFQVTLQQGVPTPFKHVGERDLIEIDARSVGELRRPRL
jgi:hypothetical protein